MGKLQEMMDKQRELQNRLGIELDSMPPEERTAKIKEFSLHVNQEMNELLYELPFFKPWKDYSNLTDVQVENGFERAREEYVDVFHFLINVGLLLGLDEEDLYYMFMDKNKVNHKRQDEGY